MKPYKVVELTQGTPDWLNFRYDYAAASDLPIIMGLSKFKSVLQLFEEKFLREESPSEEKEFVFAKGHSAEIAGRNWVSEVLKISLPPAVVVSLETPDLMASLDGFNPDMEVIFEA